MVVPTAISRFKSMLSSEIKQSDAATSLTNTLADVLHEQVPKPIPPHERDLIVAIASEMILKDKPEGIPRKSLGDKDTRNYLVDALTAATAVGMYIEMKEQEKELKQEFDKIIAMIQNDEISPEQLEHIKNQLVFLLSKLNRLDPSPSRRAKFEEAIKSKEKLDKLIKKLIERHMGKGRKGKANTQDPQKQDRTPEQENKELDEMLHNLFGIDPRSTGKIVFPVLVVVGNALGIPDYAAALSPNEPIHRLSGDMTATGLDLHMRNAAVEKLGDNLDDRMYHVSKEAPRYTRD